MSEDIIEEKEIPAEKDCDADEYVPEFEDDTKEEVKTRKEAFQFLKAMKGQILTDGGVIESIEVTFTDKKTKEKTVVKV